MPPSTPERLETKQGERVAGNRQTWRLADSGLRAAKQRQMPRLRDLLVARRKCQLSKDPFRHCKSDMLPLFSLFFSLPLILRQSRACRAVSLFLQPCNHSGARLLFPTSTLQMVPESSLFVNVTNFSIPTATVSAIALPHAAFLASNFLT